MSTLVNASNDELAYIIGERTNRLVSIVSAAATSMGKEVNSKELAEAVDVLQDVLNSLKYGSGSLLEQLRKAEEEASARFDSLVASDMVPVFEEPDQAFIDRFE